MQIRQMKEEDRQSVIEMMRVFYASEAVSTNGSFEIFTADFDACISASPYLTGYIFDEGGVSVGYAMTAHSFSTEFGKPCVWIEDIYIKEEYRHLGFGRAFFEFIESLHPDKVLRLEVEHENENALRLYKKRGFTFLNYGEMIKNEK